SGGTIPDMADYAVLLEPQGIQVGTVNEDFAVESLAGDVFQLGNQSYRIIRVETGRVRVEDARGQPPSIPFWLGEAPGRSDELSAAVGRLRARLDGLLAEGDRLVQAGEREPARIDRPRGASTGVGANGAAAKSKSKSKPIEASRSNATDTALAPEESRLAPALRWLVDELRLSPEAARQIVDYLARTRAALGALPTQHTLVMERFFDESGGTQLVIHSPFGSRINRAWGLALRKRFCRSFNFELQAAATDDAIVLSLSLAHSFALDEVWRYLRSASAEHVLVQALLDAPLFGVRWRWNATTSLALPRFTGGRRTAPQLQRMKSDDLLATVFPDQAACLENVVGEREIPHHPLVDQTLDDCLHDAMDTDGWLALLRRIESGEIELIARDLPAPSPLAAEILNAKPYAFLDDAPLEERRTQAVQSRRWSDPESADDLGALDADAIAAVRDEAWPLARDAHEMHDALLTLACVADSEANAHDGWPAWLAALAEHRRATRCVTPDGQVLWVPVERLVCMRALHPDARFSPALKVPAACAQPWEADAALVDVIRARLTGFGPLTVGAIAEPLGLPPASVETALAALEREGYVMRGRFTPGATNDEWCERHLLARIHRYTVKRLRREIEPVERADFMRFLLHWQHLTPDTRGTGRDALAAVVEQLEGYEAAAGAWEDALLPARLTDYTAGGLDELCRSGQLVWTRIGAPARAAGTPVKTTPVVLLPRRHLRAWQALRDPDAQPALSARATQVRDALVAHGAMFFDALLDELHMLPVELEQALGELVSAGLVNADSFAGLRALLKPAVKRSATYAPRTRRGGALIGGMDDAGRWALVQRGAVPDDAPAPAPKRGATATDPDALEHIVWTLLRRYGVVFWRLLEREADWLPSWRELVRVLQRLEARGEIRGGRFVAGIAGEQFALPEAIPVLREVRRQPGDGQFVCVTGVDPLNLAGTLLPGDKVPALAGNRVLFRDGVPIASLVSGTFHYAADLMPAAREDARLRLARRH
ncbi:TPA: ATP-dependent DNA helicase, partial [Burkholderia vietnamiensis]|nr:ATP-dependent DNA helicase [Burkholderia vietnamiensis]